MTKEDLSVIIRLKEKAVEEKKYEVACQLRSVQKEMEALELTTTRPTMQIIIENGNSKRLISGPYNICGSGADLIRLRDAINGQVKDKNYYGWVRIVHISAQHSIASTPPKTFDE